jgi:predicted transcriptional regulator
MARLGDLERSVMDVLWDTEGWLTAREVASRLHHDRDLAYTTVLTVLERLERKGFVRRQRAARAHRYASANSREAVVAEAMLEALGAAGDRSSALVQFVGAVTAEEAEILRRALAAPVSDADQHPDHQHPDHRFASGLGPRIASGLGPRIASGPGPRVGDHELSGDSERPGDSGNPPDPESHGAPLVDNESPTG